MKTLSVFRTIYHFHPDPVIVFAPRNVLYANPAALMHLPDDPVQNHLPFAVADMLSPGHALSFAQWQEMLERTNQTGSYSLGVERKGEKYTTEWLLTLLSGLPGQEEELYALQVCDRLIKRPETESGVALQQQISLLKEKLDEVKKEARFFHSMVEDAPDVIMRFDRKFRYVYINNKGQGLSGLPADHYLGKRVDDPAIQMPQYIFDIWRKSLEEVFRNAEKKRVEFRFPNGIWVDWHLAPEMNEKGEVEMVTAVARNITAFKNLQEQLQDSKADLQALAEAYPDVVMEFDRECRHLYCSENVIEDTGIPADQFIGKTHEELGFPPELCRFWEKHIKQVFDSKQTSRVEFKFPNGIFIDWYLVPKFGKDGEVVSVYGFTRDISHIKAIEEELQLNEYKLSFALETSGVVFWELNLDDFTVEMTESHALFYKLPYVPEKGKRYRIKEDIIDLVVVEEDRPFLLQLMADVKELGAKKAIDNKSIVHRIRSEGEIFYLLINLKVVKNNEGKLICFGTSQDITELKRKENELEYYKNKLEKLVEERTRDLKRNRQRLYDAMMIAKLGIWELDLSQDQVLISDTVFKSLKLPIPAKRFDQLPYSKVLSFIHPADRARVKRLFEQVIQSGNQSKSFHIEFRAKDAQNNTFMAFASVKLSTENGQKLYGIVQDISELRKAEAEIERLNAIVETTPDIVAIVSSEGQIQYLNEAGQHFFGLTFDEVNKPLFAWEKNQYKTLHLLNEKVVEKLKSSEIWQGEISLLDQDGHEVPFSQVVIAYFDEESNIECYSTIIRNMSEQKQVEKDLLFKKNEMNTFVYRAYHDLKGPVTTMKGLYKIVQIDLKENKKALSYFTMYNREAEKLQNTLLSLIDLTRITDKPVKHRKLSLERLIEEGLRSFEKYPGFCEVRFSTDIDIPYPYKGDKKLIYTILHYLIQNAIDFRDPKKDCSVKVEVYPSSTEDSLVLAVCDNGIGIEPEVQGHIFNMFYRGSERSQGSGLGLYMVKVIADRLGAKVMVKSHPGKGTTISVFLPYLK